MKISPLQAIRKYCIECSGGCKVEVENCPIKSCPLYVFRFGPEIQKIDIDKEIANSQQKKTKTVTSPPNVNSKITVSSSLEDIELIKID
jgi:hypothetical protein